MASYLRSIIKDDLDRGKVTREAAFAALEALWYGSLIASMSWEKSVILSVCMTLRP
jgi:hypothetical protein